MRRLAFILFMLSFAFSVAAQTEKVTAQVNDDLGVPIPGATGSLFLQTGNTLVKAAVSDKTGKLDFENLRPGNYYLTVTSVGFENYRSEPFELRANAPLTDLKAISLKAATNTIKAVDAVAKRPFIEKKLDKTIVNVENSIVAAGNSVLEILEKAPGVTVNQESSINLKGKQGVIVMIDGKPSPLSGADLITYLKGVPSANVSNIELITNPSARYDAAGNAGIINIKFKKDQRQGFNGSLALSYGQGRFQKPNGSTNLNFREGDWNVFGSYSLSQPKSFTRFDIERKFYNNNALTSTFDQRSFIEQPITSHNAKFGADYNLGKKTILGVMFNTNWNNNNRDGSTTSNVTLPNGQLDYTTRTSIVMAEQRFNGFGNFNFKHSINATGHELTADVDFGRFNAANDQNVNNANYNGAGNQINADQLLTDQSGIINVRAFKVDYVYPFSKTAKFEAGAKSSFVESDNDVAFYNVINQSPVFDANRSNHFIYNENINALYTSFAKEFKTTDFQFGLRMEHTNTKGEQLATGDTFSRGYVNFFPSAVVNQKLSESHQLTLSFSKRIDRPTYRQLNPFRIFVDPYTYVVGDPMLKPVMTYATEFSHTFKNKFITTVAYSKSKDIITDVFEQDDATKISNQIPANLDDFEQVNFDVFIPVTSGKWFNGTLTGSVFYNKYSSPFQGGMLVNDYTAFDVRTNNSFILGNGWAAELNGFYQSKNAYGLFVIKNLAQVSAGIQKTSKDKNSTFKLSVSDLFYTNHIAVEVKYQNMDFVTDRTWDSRVATLSFSQRFGKTTVTRARQRAGGAEEEKRRAG